MLDGPDFGECQLLAAHLHVERGVVARDRQYLRAVEHRFARGPIEDDLPACGDTDRDPGRLHDAAAGAGAGREVSGPVSVARKVAKEAAPGQIFTERLNDLLVMALSRPAERIPRESPSWN